MIADILLGTPRWVFGLFALLLWLGLGQLRSRSLPIRRICLTPIFFLIWGMVGIALRSRGMDAGLASWLVAAALGLLIGLARRNSLVIDHARGLVTRPGSILPLVRNLGVFGAHYVLNVAAALHPGQHRFLILDMAISGVFAGYFIGWLLRFVERVRESSGDPPRTDDKDSPCPGTASA
jgi:hypothetical protein